MPTKPLKLVLRQAGALKPGTVSLALCADESLRTDLPSDLRSLAKGLQGALEHRGSRTESPWEKRGSISVTRLSAAQDVEDRDVTAWARAEIDSAVKRGIRQITLVLPRCSATLRKGGAASLLAQILQSTYRFDPMVSKAKAPSLRSVAVVAPKGQHANYASARSSAIAVADGMSFARTLGNTPPNVATPAWMASQARALAKRHGMKAEVLTPRELEKRGMGGILGVGQGSVNTPRLVRLTYGTKGPKVALVGKGVTFDTGGISIKPSASMEEMKYDKCGACTVLGVAEAVGQLKLDVQLSVYVPLAENMPDAAAYRPSDIVTCYNGKTVEIINTDAEGRMLLADSMAWACEDSPDILLEYSTLTGACVVALGEGAAALYTPSDALAKRALGSAERAGERLWRMPLWPEFVRQMKGTHSDLKNSGPRWGGANTAAAFLSQFVDGVDQWAHIDIAGPAYSANAEGRGRRGATGYAVAFTVDCLQSLA
ncbi:MAG: leucyl aminopeptidase [Acidobacteriota bacterium]